MLKQLANMTTEKLIEMFELTTNMNDENIPTVDVYKRQEFAQLFSYARRMALA